MNKIDRMRNDIYKSIKVRYAADPGSVTKDERAALILFSLNRYINLVKGKYRALDEIKKRVAQAQALVNGYKTDSYAGTDIALEFFKILPVNAAEVVDVLKDYDLAEEIYKVDNEFITLYEAKAPKGAPEYDASRENWIQDEKNHLASTGWVPTHRLHGVNIDEEAHRRYTMMVLMGRGPWGKTREEFEAYENANVDIPDESVLWDDSTGRMMTKKEYNQLIRSGGLLYENGVAPPMFADENA